MLEVFENENEKNICESCKNCNSTVRVRWPSLNQINRALNSIFAYYVLTVNLKYSLKV